LFKLLTLTPNNLETYNKYKISREVQMVINISSADQDFLVAELRHGVNNQQPHTVTYFDAYSLGKTKNFEISGGGWLSYFGTGWYIYGKGDSLHVKTEINKNPQDRYELDFTGTGWYSPDFTLDVTVNGTHVGTVSYPLAGRFKNEAKFDITNYVNDGTNTIDVTLADGEFILTTFRISNE
jgi:hypothetical protein